MDNTNYLAAKQIRLRQKSIDRVLAILESGTFSNSNLQEAYTLFSDLDTFLEYVGEIYTDPPTVTFEGDGTGAAGIATIEDGILASVAVTDPGSGYTEAPVVVFTDGGGRGAAAVAVLSSGDTVASVNVVHQSLIANLVSKRWALDDDFAAL